MPNMLDSLFGGGRRRREEDERRRREEFRAREAAERRALIIRQVYDELWSVVQNTDNGPKRFVCYTDLSRIWDLSRVIQPLAGDLDWGDPVSMSTAREHFLRVMSTLVWIKWDRWEEFGSSFLHYSVRGVRTRTDKDLPFGDTSFLHTDPLSKLFTDEQYIFNPMVIIEDDPEEESTYVEYSEKDRLPFTRTQPIGRGGSGTVTKEEIPPFYFKFKNRSSNTEPMFVARKCFPGAGRFDRSFEIEQKNLKAFKKCLNQNGNIMPSFAAFLHGSDFNIISPLADLDLHAYFEGSYDDFHQRSRWFSPAQLLHGAACLAGALRFLHEGLQPVSIAEKIYCAHLDLKPENILVIWARGANLPAGRWLVHDFGTSKIKESRNTHSSKTLVAPGDFIRQFSLTQASRTPGPFQAPEVQNSTERVVGTESDIWSLGCILAQVLTFALGGPAFVSQLGHSTCEGFNDDYFYDRTDENFPLKAPVAQYLNSLSSSYQDNTWITETLRLIEKILVKTPRLRPSAKEVQDTLERVYSRRDASLLKPCPWANSGIPPPSPAPSPQVEQFPLQRGLEPNQRLDRIDRPQFELNQRSQGSAVQPLRSMPSLPHVIIRPPTRVNGPSEDQAGLEVVGSPISSPVSEALSQGEMESTAESRRARYSLSRSSSTSTRPVSLTEDATFIQLFVPRNSFKTIICPSSCHVAFISKRQTSIMHIVDQGWTAIQKPPMITAGYLHACTKDNPASFEWVDGCMSGAYIVLKARRFGGRDCKIYRYRCDDGGHTWNEEPIIDTANSASMALDITVSVRGDVVFICDDQLLYYSTQYGFLPLTTIGRHRIGSARFSPDGTWVFGWSHDRGLNHFYKWDTTHHQWRSETDHARTLKRKWHIREQPRSPDRAGFGNPAIYPFLNYFVAFDRPHRVLTVGKDNSYPVTTQVQREVRDIIGGTSVQGTILVDKKVESLVLLQRNTSQLMTLPITHQGAGNPSEGVKLKLKFNVDADALAVFRSGSDFYILVSHFDGRLERRRVSST